MCCDVLWNAVECCGMLSYTVYSGMLLCAVECCAEYVVVCCGMLWCAVK